MISELVVSASLLMLSAAQQYQIYPSQMEQFPNLQPASGDQSSLSNTPIFMVQRANTILSQDFGTPLEPGLFTGPVLVSETAQNILDQESKVVGYNIIPHGHGLAHVVQQQQQLPVQQQINPFHGTQFVTVNGPQLPNIPRTIPVTAADAVPRAKYGQFKPIPQSLTIPLLSNGHDHGRQPINVVPVRAAASIKDLIGSGKQSYKEPAYFNFKNLPLAHPNKLPSHSDNKYFYNREPQPNPIRSTNPHANLYDNVRHIHHVPQRPLKHQTHSARPNLHSNLFDDIPRNHPVPPPPHQSHQHQQQPLPQTNPTHSEPPRNIYYDIPPNHPVPPPPSQSNRNSFEELHFPQSLKQANPDTRFQLSSVQDLRSGDYTPAQPPPQNSIVDQSKDSEIINLMPPLPYREHVRPEQQEQFVQLSAVNHHPQLKTVQGGVPEIDLSPPIHDFLPKLIEQESSKTILVKPQDISEEQDVPTTYRPNLSEEEELETPKPKKSPRRKSKARSESKQKGSSSDTETSHSENFYQQAPHEHQGYSGGNEGGYAQDGGGWAPPRVHKHIFVHAAPEYHSQAPRVRVVRPPTNPEKHVNIIFVKSPSPPPETETVVELPPEEPPKTFVYVLSKQPKDEDGGKVRFITPPTPKPRAPEIFFIRYGANGHGNNKGYPVPNLQSLYDNHGALSNPQPQLDRSPSGPYAQLQQPDPLSRPPVGPYAQLQHEPHNRPLVGHHHSQPHIETLDRPPSGLLPPKPFRRMALRHKREKNYGLDVYAPLMAYSKTGEINEITQEEADSRRTKLEDFF